MKCAIPMRDVETEKEDGVQTTEKARRFLRAFIENEGKELVRIPMDGSCFFQTMRLAKPSINIKDARNITGAKRHDE